MALLNSANLNSNFNDVPGKSGLFLTYRRSNQGNREERLWQEALKLAFLSVEVETEVLDWIGNLESVQRERLFKATCNNSGWEATNGGLFQSLLLHRWLKPDNHELQLNISPFRQDRENSKWKTDLANSTRRLLTWESARGIRNIRSSLERRTLYYELTSTANLALIDALLINDESAYLFQITRAETHSLSLAGLKKILDFLPREVKDMSYVLILELYAAKVPE